MMNPHHFIAGENGNCADCAQPDHADIHHPDAILIYQQRQEEQRRTELARAFAREALALNREFQVSDHAHVQFDYSGGAFVEVILRIRPDVMAELMNTLK